MSDNLLTLGWSTDGEGLWTRGWNSMAALNNAVHKGVAVLEQVEHLAVVERES